MTAPSDVFLRASDAFTWAMERDPALRSTVVVLLWLDRVPDWPTLVRRIDRMSRQVPGMRQKVVETPTRLAPPRWVADPAFDLHWHLRRASAPASDGGRDSVLELARRAAMGAFDQDRPLWEFTLVEGVDAPDDGAPGSGARAAFVMKIHHSLSDGVGGMRLLTVLVDLERDAADLGDLPEAPATGSPGLASLVRGAAVSLGGRLAHLARRSTVAVGPALGHALRHPEGSVRGVGSLARSVYRTAGPMRETLSPVMRERTANRRLVMLQVPLPELKVAAVSAEVTVNDAYLAALAGGLRRYHERHQAPVEALRVTMPINLRTEGDAAWGNRITLQRLTLPVAEPDPVARMRLVHGVAAAARREPSLRITDTIAGALNMLPVGYVGGILKHVDLLASNVPGSPVPIYLTGAGVTGFFAFGPTIGTSLNATLVSHRGTCDVGLTVDTAAVRDVDLLLACLAEGFVEIGARGVRTCR